MTDGWSVEAAARTSPAQVALLTDGGAWTYRALAARVRGAARALAAAGVDFAAAGDPSADPGRVMMVAPSTVDTVVALLALFERGVPVMLVHPRSTTAERDALARAYPPAVRLDDGPPPATAAETGPPPPPSIPESRDLAVFFTSGTTGRPKAVRLSRGAFEASAAASARNLGWTPNDRWLLSIPLAHVGGLSILTRCLLARRAVVLLEGPNRQETLDRAAREHAVTLVSLVPTQLKRWLPSPPPPTLRAALIGGAPLPDGLRDVAVGAKWPILTTYGLTEACSQVTVQPYPPSDLGAAVHRAAGDGDSGRPLAGTEVAIRDGRIFVRGPTLLTGYLRSADGPPAPPPFDGEGWFDTGDLGHMTADGRLMVHARRQDLILSGGENVYPKEIESALMSQPAIEDAVVFGVDDAEWGQAVAAAVVAAGPLDLPALSLAMRTVLAGPKRPRYWAVFERFCLAPSGKIDRRAVIGEARGRLRVDPGSGRWSG